MCLTCLHLNRENNTTRLYLNQHLAFALPSYPRACNSRTLSQSRIALITLLSRSSQCSSEILAALPAGRCVGVGVGAEAEVAAPKLVRTTARDVGNKNMMIWWRYECFVSIQAMENINPPVSSLMLPAAPRPHGDWSRQWRPSAPQSARSRTRLAHHGQTSCQYLETAR